MKNKNQFITRELAERISLSQFNLENAQVLPQNSLSFFQKQKTKETIYIYDVGFNKNHNIIAINNHINKTGSNPMCGQKKINFYDITQIYQQQKRGQIVECFGLHSPNNKGDRIKARFLCHHTIAAYCAGIKKIFAYIID